MSDDIEWGPDGAPRSRRYGDVFFQPEDGLAESRAVFLAGAGLPDRWAGRDGFQISELGFGLGLNFLATWALWRSAPTAPALTYAAVEASPPSMADIRRCAARWPEINALADAFEHAMEVGGGWPPPPGWSRRMVVETPAPLVLEIGVGCVSEVGPSWPGVADVWFLDGFSPSKNPDMWSLETLSLVAARTRPGGLATTYAAAGWVRRTLAAAGFEVARAPGFGRKRERLVAVKPSAVQAPRTGSGNRPNTGALTEPSGGRPPKPMT